MIRTMFSGFDLKNDFESAPADGSCDQLIPVTIFPVPSDFEVEEKAFDRFFKCHIVRGKLIALEVVFKIGRYEPAPVNHNLSFTFLPIATVSATACFETTS